MIGTLQSGGVSKSIVNLLSVFDKEKYDVHLFLMCKDGDVFSKFLPQDITVHTNEIIEALHQNLHGIKYLLYTKHPFLAMGSLLRMCLSKISKSKAGELLAFLMPKFTTEYFDLIVDYGGQQQLYYMINKLNGRYKITFFHSDYSKWAYYYKADKKYYPQTDHIFTISETCSNALKSYFPECKDKISVMENILSPTLIRKQAKRYIKIPQSDLLLVTVGHFCKQKGSDIIIETAKILKAKGIVFKWIYIGKIIDQKLYAQIEKEDLSDFFYFTGIVANPYPYINAANIYVHPSRYEGKSIALDEAKILCKPIVVTNFSTVNDQFSNHVNASICKMNAEDLTDKIMELYQNSELQKKYTQYLLNNITDNSKEVDKLYKFLS